MKQLPELKIGDLVEYKYWLTDRQATKQGYIFDIVNPGNGDLFPYPTIYKINGPIDPIKRYRPGLKLLKRPAPTTLTILI